MMILAYWETVKQYYANLQENLGAVIHYGNITPTAQTVDDVIVRNVEGTLTFTVGTDYFDMAAGYSIILDWTGTAPDPKQIMINMKNNGLVSFYDLVGGAYAIGGSSTYGTYNITRWGTDMPMSWSYSTNTQPQTVAPRIVTGKLTHCSSCLS